MMPSQAANSPQYVLKLHYITLEGTFENIEEQEDCFNRCPSCGGVSTSGSVSLGSGSQPLSGGTIRPSILCQYAEYDVPGDTVIVGMECKEVPFCMCDDPPEIDPDTTIIIDPEDDGDPQGGP